MASKSKSGRTPPNPWLVVRRSPVHGNGCFARRFIPKGTRIIEYLGERISHREADRRYEGEDASNNHTFLFIADRKTVIDATRGGNQARWVNHHCDGNCESDIKKSRVYIEARRNIEKGEELGYDYQIGRDKSDPPNVDEIYACRCGSPKCRGSMLWPPKRKTARKKSAPRKSAARKTARPRVAKAAPKRKKKSAVPRSASKRRSARRVAAA